MSACRYMDMQFTDKKRGLIFQLIPFVQKRTLFKNSINTV